MHGPPPAIVLEDVRLTLTSAAGPVDILSGVSLAVECRRGGRAARAIRLRQIVAADGGGGAGGARPPAAPLSPAPTSPPLGEDALARFRRGNVGIVFQSFHLIPTMTALENVAVPLELAGASRRLRPRARRTRHGRAGRAHGSLSRRNSPAASSSAWRWPAPWRHARKCCSRTNPPAISTRRRAQKWPTCLFALHARARTTLFLVTHEEALARRCQRILRLKDGRIVADERVSA